MKKWIIFIMIFMPFFTASAESSNQTHQNIFYASRDQVASLLDTLNAHHDWSPDQQLLFLVHHFLNRPYLYTHATSERAWQLYRTDGFNCQTFVTFILACFYAADAPSFKQTFLRIAYGAIGNPSGAVVTYFNRNHFVESDFNPINEANGYFEDAQQSLNNVARTVVVTIDRSSWLRRQFEAMGENPNNVPDFPTKTIVLRYLPKEALIHKVQNTYQPNQALFDRLPTPAVVEIVHDPKKWREEGVGIKEKLGTALAVSHLGLLYRQTFQQGAFIYNKITCNRSQQCDVQPIFCQKQNCHELMFADATDVYPKHDYFYQNENGKMVCRPILPPGVKAYTTCNRVEAKPFYAYLTDPAYGEDLFMQRPSIVGIHIETIIGMPTRLP